MKKATIMCHDVLAGIFYFLNKKGKTFGSRIDLHEKIYNLKRNYGFSLLRDFNFSTDGILPVSDEIGDSLFSLRVSNMIYFKNPGIELNEKSKKVIEREIFSKKFSKEDLNQLEKIAKEYKELHGEINVPAGSNT